MKLRQLIGLSFILIAAVYQSCNSQPTASPIIPGDVQLDRYLPLIKDKRVAVVGNHSASISDTHLIDTLLSLNINVVKALAPEHGFRGDKSDGAMINHDVDAKTGIPIISMYGKTKTLDPALFKDIDVVIFDIQDVGVRFFTFISAMHYVMEACAESGTPLIVLDKPNPNGMYIDGPVLDSSQRSYIGVHKIPVVHALTVGELAEMINGEGWLTNAAKCDLTVIPVKNYTHKMPYHIAVKPSPNLPNDLAITLYPSLALFEGTQISVGRGTYKPFLQIGHPSFTDLEYTFTPVSIEGMSKYPPLEGQVCHGYNLENIDFKPHFTLKYLIEFYQKFDDKEHFFKPYFNKLIGNTVTMEQIEAGLSEKEIKASWQPELSKYKNMRKKYLLYPDFE
ncbi:MAG TPA: DUF1343 domain-containing protein [Fulvivirga sp.]|nr:DUF1343 domain-containing protein [Fulvivirga sp.]